MDLTKGCVAICIGFMLISCSSGGGSGSKDSGPVDTAGGTVPPPSPPPMSSPPPSPPPPPPVPDASWSDNFRLAAGIGAAQNPNIAVDDSGNGLAVWMQDNGTRHEVRSRRYSATSQTWGDEVILDAGSGSATWDPWPIQTKVKTPLYVSMAGNGNAVVAWTEQATTTETSQVWVNVFSDKTKSWKGAKRLSSVTTANARYPVATINKNEQVVVTWIQSGLYMSTQTDGTWSEPVVLAASASTADSVVDDVGEIWAVWNSPNVWATRCAIGSTCSPPTQLDNLVSVAEDAQIALDGTGGATVVWSQAVGNVRGLYANMFNSTDSVWGKPQLIENMTDNAVQPSIVSGSNGLMYVVWSQSIYGAGLNLDFFGEIYFASYSPNIGWSSPLSIYNIGGAAPRVGVDASENVYLLWKATHSYYSIRRNGGSFSYGEKLAGPTDMDGFPGYNTGRHNNLSVSKSGIAIAVWKKDDNGSVYAQIYR